MFLQYLSSDPIFYLRVVTILIISISLHELGHGIAAIFQGDDTPVIKGHMTMNPLVHMGIHSIFFLLLAGIAWGQMPVNPSKFRHPKWGSILVSAAGPLTNIALGMLAMLVINLSLYFDWNKIVSLEFFYIIARFNFVLCLFNLIPIPPLDGYHVASEIIPEMKALGRSKIGLALFMILFISGIGGELFSLADIIVRALII
ncbi:site-2 protease family protein [Waterburya agarophytonicola K14]|uniref:Site-2 protease family protein n=1 Tax=Waterburya agarophytonicola KI4 TaxID=2874699 RepID=A0A964BTA9_9CYAN|nr:site-2 protease family protein [Waterburya agarophytonicola]MCC0179100.1 site-2 protease family protein [Waterburya agarophytonicola KI4]